MSQFPSIQRPVGQRAVNAHGAVSSFETVAVTVSALVLTLSLPSVTVTTGATTVPVTPQVLTVAAPDTTPATSAVSVPIPFGKPFTQYGVRFFGPPSRSTTPDIPLTQTVQVSPVNVAFSATTAQVFLPAIIRDTGAHSLTLSAPPVSVAAGPVTQVVTPQVLPLALPNVGFDAGVNPSLPALFRRAVGQRGIRGFGPPSLTTSPETTFAQTVGITAVEVTLSAPDVVRTGAVTLPSTVVSLALSIADAAPVIPSPGVTTNPIITKSRFMQRRAIARRPLVSQHGAVEYVESTTAFATAQTITLSLPNVTRVSGRSTQPVTAMAVALSVPTATVSGGTAGVLSAGTARLTLSVPDASVTTGGTTKTFTAPTLALSAPDIQVNRVVALNQLTAVLSLPPVSVSQAAVRATGNQVVQLSPPAVTVVVQTAVRPAGQQSVALTAPAVVRASHVPIASTRAAVSLSLPSVSVTTGPTTVLVTPMVMALKMTVPNVVGATELPIDTFEGTLESRLPENTLEAREFPYTLHLRA